MILGARVLGEFGDDPNRYPTAKSCKNYAGILPPPPHHLRREGRLGPPGGTDSSSGLTSQTRGISRARPRCPPTARSSSYLSESDHRWERRPAIPIAGRGEGSKLHGSGYGRE
jgi:hypothetical protein